MMFFYCSFRNSAKNKEYFLALGPDMMIGEPFNILSSIDSTNNHAMRLAKAGCMMSGTAFFAMEQTQGKGQMGRIWSSNKGQNIMMSIVLSGNALDLCRPFAISCLVASSAHELLSQSGSDEFCIKWPNDIFWRDRKAGGILIENVISNGKWELAVIGIGLNINQTVFENMTAKAVSLKQITGKEADPIQLARQLCGILDKRLNQYMSSGDFGLAYFNSNLFKRNMPAELDYGSGPHLVEIQYVDENGHLVIETATGTKSLVSGNVRWIL